MAASEDPTTRQYLVLGPVEAHLDARVLPVAPGKQTVLLAALLTRPGHSIPTASLAEALWAHPPPGAAGTLRALISKLRRALTDENPNGGAAGANLLVAAAGGYRLRVPAADARGGRDGLDARTFSSLLVRARAARAAGEAASAVDAYRVALRLWRGSAFAGATGGNGVGTLITGAARRLDSERIAAIEECLAVELQLGRHAEVLGELEAVVAAEPLRERPHELLMVALYRAGRQQDALAVYRRLRISLADELGVEPTPRVRILHEQLLRQDPVLDADVPALPRASAGTPMLRRAPASASFAPDRARVGNGSAAAAVAADVAAVGNLPVVRDALVGREELLAEVASLVTTSRLVTLTGPGGVGKTRLATSAAAAAALTARDDEPGAACFPEGAWCVDLAAVSASSHVADAVSTILAVQPRRGVAALDRLVQHLGTRRLLLVLDSCEHVIEAVAEVVDAVGRGCPHVAVLATSRESLRVAGERVRLVPPLDVPAPCSVEADDVQRAAAVALFVTRARATAPEFSLSDGNAAAVAEICRRLDGVPLALELAAARMRSMTAPEVASRLGQRFRLLHGGQRAAAARHRSLRATIDWSYELLDDDEQHVFDRLSVFSGGFTLQAAERVIVGSDAKTSSPTRGEVLDEVAVAGLLAGLVDKSMIVAASHRASTRYRLLETLRSYGRERLAARGEEPAARSAHAAHLTAFVEDAAQRLKGPAGAAAGEAIARELDDLRAAHAWAVDRALDEAVRLVAAMFRFVEHRMPPEVPLWAERAIEAAEVAPARQHPLMPRVYAVAARGAARRGDLHRASDLAERGAASVGGDDPERRHPLYARGVIALFEGRLEEAGRLTAEVQRLAQATDDVWLVVRALVIRGLAHLYAGNTDAALAMAAHARDVADPAGDPAARGWSRYISGEALLEVDPEQAALVLDEALAAARAIDDRYLAGVTMVSATSVRARHGDPRQAASLFRDVIAHWHVVGNWTQQWTTVRNVVELLIRAGLDGPAAVLLGATQGSGTAPPAFGVAAVRIARARQDLEDRLGTDAVLHATRRGAAMSDEQALRLARTTLDRLAPPAPPTRGHAASAGAAPR